MIIFIVESSFNVIIINKNHIMNVIVYLINELHVAINKFLQHTHTYIIQLACSNASLDDLHTFGILYLNKQ